MSASDSDSSPDYDLPLKANTHDISVYHYVLDLQCDMQSKVLHGSITLFLRPVVNPDEDRKQCNSVLSSVSCDHNSKVECTNDNESLKIQTKFPSTNLDVNHIQEGAPVTWGPLCDHDNYCHHETITVEACDNVTIDTKTVEHLRCSDNMTLYDTETVVSTQAQASCTISYGNKRACHEFTDCHEFTYSSKKVLNNIMGTKQIHSCGAHMNTSNNGEENHKEGTLFYSPLLSSMGNYVVTPHSCDVPGGDINLTRTSSQGSPFCLILDCVDVTIISVEEITLPKVPDISKISSLHNSTVAMESLLTCSKSPGTNLPYCMEKWCIKIWKPGVYNSKEFPCAVRVVYRTSADGASLRWTQDQDGRPCVFTAGHWINNRSLFPSQDVSTALMTWQAFIRVPEVMSVVMSGDHDPISTNDDGFRQFYFFTTMPMPSSTVSIAIGSWYHVQLINIAAKRIVPDFCSTVHGEGCGVNYCSSEMLPCRLYAPSSIFPQAKEVLQSYLPLCLQAAHDVLGPHPFMRLDVLVAPECFESLGLASPSMIIISQTVLATDSSLCIRLAHEVSHSWFGLLIGACDWTEEWLSEGFATYLEDVIHAKAMGYSSVQTEEHGELRALLRHRTLMAEVGNTQTELQVLRPNQGAQFNNTEKDVFVKNGMNPYKAFTQIHYLKGYFLLRYMADIVGYEKFNSFFRLFAEKYHGALVTSQNVLHLAFEMFPEICDAGHNEEHFSVDWLDSPGVPLELRDYQVRQNNSLITTVYTQVTRFTKHCVSTKVKSKRKKQKSEVSHGNILEDLHPDQLVLFLELLLDETKLPLRTLQLVYTRYNIPMANAEVRHRWCELVVKHKHEKWYPDVRNFLLHDQAMGVYLYGELILSGSKMQRQLAEECCNMVSAGQDAERRAALHEMVYGQPLVNTVTQSRQGENIVYGSNFQ